MQSSSSTNVDFYERLATEYDLFFHNLEKNMAEEGDWLAGTLAPYSPRHVLDASCGSGRQAIPLARLGLDVIAADPSGAMLASGQKRAEREGLAIRWIKAGFQELTQALSSQFDAVIALGNGLCNQESTTEIEASLRVLHTLTAESGVCLVGIKDYDSIRTGFEPVHGRGMHDNGDERAILFDVWERQEPHLISTAFLLTGKAGAWTVQTAATREYMLSGSELRDAARASGFGSIERLDHPSEAVYLLRH